MLIAIGLVIQIVTVIAIVFAVRGPKKETLVATTASAVGSTITPDQRAVLHQRLHYERRAKLVGALVGFMLPGFVKAFVELPTAVNPFSMGFAGLLIGAIAGATRDSAPRGSRRSAHLRERRIDHYAPAQALLWTRGLAALTVAVAALTAPLGNLIGACVHPDMARSAGGPALAAAFALIATALVEIGIRLIIGRGQAAEPEGLMEIDDMLRARAVTAATAAGLAAVILSLTFAASATVASGPVCASGEWTRILLIDTVIAATGFVTAIGVWISFTWRRLPRPAGATTGRDVPR